MLSCCVPSGNSVHLNCWHLVRSCPPAPKPCTIPRAAQHRKPPKQQGSRTGKGGSLRRQHTGMPIMNKVNIHRLVSAHRVKAGYCAASRSPDAEASFRALTEAATAAARSFSCWQPEEGSGGMQGLLSPPGSTNDNALKRHTWRHFLPAAS